MDTMDDFIFKFPLFVLAREVVDDPQSRTFRISGLKQRCQEPLFSPDRFKGKTRTAQQAVQADPNKRRVSACEGLRLR